MRRSPFHRLVLAGILLGAVLLAACGSEMPRSAADIETAVRDYLAQRTDLKIGDMQVRADRIRYDGDRAVASVSIIANDDPKAAMKMMYQLERDGDRWRVVPAAASEIPPATGSGPADLPPGHPPVGGASPSLPPGHPPLTDQGQ